jgi:hypothetical protein
VSEIATLACPDCGVSSNSSDPSGTHWHCDSCGRGYYLRRCANCQEVSYVALPHGWHALWFCTWCAAPNIGFTQFQDPAAATVTELAISIARQQLSFTLAKDVAAKTTEYVELGSDPSPSPNQTTPDLAVTRRRSRRGRTILVVAAGALAVLGVTAALIGMHPGPAISASAPRSAPTRTPRSTPAPGTSHAMQQVSVTVAQATTVSFQGIPGTLSVVGADTTRVSLTGQLRWTGRAPVAVTRLDPGTHVLLLSYQCAPASPCTEDYQLVMPATDALVLRQSSAQLTLSGLVGPVSVAATNVQVTATGMRASALIATITSGTFSASFDAAPSLVSVTLMSAQGTLRLPASTTYQVTQQVDEGTVAIHVPQARTATHRVTARITSGDLELLSS